MSAEFVPSEAALDFMLSPPGTELLDRLAALPLDENSLLGHVTRLRQSYVPDVVAAALDLALLRRHAEGKFTRARAMFFTREALEQASAESVAGYRARRFARYPAAADLCCGIGGDALALAALADVLAIDSQPLRLRMAEANARAYGVGDRLHTCCADVTTFPLPRGTPIWADPSRRVEGRRVFALDAYLPPLSALLPLARRAPAAGIKLAPGVDYGELGALLSDLEHEVEILSVKGEAREAVLWLGEAVTARRRATLLPGGHTLTAHPLPAPVPVVPPGRYLYEPDAAVIRAHLVEHLAVAIGAAKLDDQIAYLTADALVETPFATAYRIQEAMPFQLKHLNHRLRALDIGELVIKKRGFAVDPEQFRHRLKYGGGRRTVVLVLTHAGGRPTALICEPETATWDKPRPGN
jgi:SAM-dependent methyltransferase